MADFSIVYPVARGTGPMVSVICAIAFLHERATWLGLTGTTAVLVGIVLIAARGHLDRVADSAAQRGIRYGAATGSVIAAYTVVDAYGVKTLGLQPVILDWCANTVRLFMLLPWFLSNPRAALATMKGHMLRAIIVGLLSPLSYILVLGALQLGAPVSLVAPAREMSMMIGAVLGVVVLGEPVGLSRAAGCLLMLGGVILISCS